MKEKTPNFKEQPRKIVQFKVASVTREYCQSTRVWPETFKDNIAGEKPDDIEPQSKLPGEHLLGYDSGSDEREKFLNFNTEQSLDLLEGTPQCRADGTFKRCPALFCQLYAIQGVLNGHTIPLVYMFLKR